MTDLLTLEALTALATLSVMEIVLGIDNIVFLSILVARLPEKLRAKARNIGLILALGMRIGLLFSISWIMSLTKPFAQVWEFELSGRNLILLLGGLFLVAKATFEIHHKIEGVDDTKNAKPVSSKAFASIIFQIIILDLVFSLDSVITAVGMAKQISVMVLAMVIAMGVMLWSAKSIGDFVERHPTVKILALSFLILIGVMLMAEGMGQHISKGYIYFAMAFSLTVEILNLRFRSSRDPIKG